ncbi:hypothetical protein HID58_044843 [Brassica napus]|uniref:Legume lectin domain-containing protein n=1 Tax=Brassica napus TaxID=3708 RepID=A0ABQ7XFP1_BRANA|nr:hypothetical protein HID58_044843 [Brassica napus]
MLYLSRESLSLSVSSSGDQTWWQKKNGHAFYTKPIQFKDIPNATVSSVSTTFVFAIYSQIPTLSGHGIVFVVSPSHSLTSALPIKSIHRSLQQLKQR